MAATAASLKTLARLRQRALDMAQQGLVACLDVEAGARVVLRDAQAAARREQDLAASLTATDAAVEAFARWLPEGRRTCEDAETVLADAEAATAQARAQLSASRAAARAADELLEARLAAERALAERKLQAALDEAALRCR